ncbi:MAG: hypothetical protein ACXVRH_02785 [Thermoleophilaceae bacterium]
MGKGGSSGGGSGSFAALARKLPQIERRVEQIRGLRFRRPLRPQLVTGAQARSTGLAELDRIEPPATQASESELLELLGLIPPGASLRTIQGEVLQDQVAGFYDTDTKRLALVSDAGAGGDDAVGEITLAHELTHALDDQSFGIHDTSSASGDPSDAYTALVEGDATVVMSRYAERFVSRGDLFRAALGGSSGASTAKLPPYVEASLEFPYLAGASFVNALYAVAGDWKLVNFALRTRPPVPTEQVMHPLKYEADERPLPVRLDVRPLMPPGWKPALSSTLGEFTTGQLLKPAVGAQTADAAAAGWGGDRVELWSDGHSRYALVAAWRFDTPGDSAQFEPALRAYGARRPGPHAVATRNGITTLALAPSAALAARLAVQAVAAS